MVTWSSEWKMTLNCNMHCILNLIFETNYPLECYTRTHVKVTQLNLINLGYRDEFVSKTAKVEYQVAHQLIRNLNFSVEKLAPILSDVFVVALDVCGGNDCAIPQNFFHDRWRRGKAFWQPGKKQGFDYDLYNNLLLKKCLLLYQFICVMIQTSNFMCCLRYRQG